LISGDVSAVTGVTHTQPVAPITAVSRKPYQAKPQSSSDVQDTVHLSSAAQAHLSALQATTREVAEKEGRGGNPQAQRLPAKENAAVRK
jgi:hypothetical protein